MAFFRRESPAAGQPVAQSTADASSGASPLAALPAPKTERLDRNKLSIIAAFAGMGVIGMVVFMQPSAPSNTAARADVPTPQGGTYLDQPVRGAVAAGASAAGGASGPVASTTPGSYGSSYDAAAAGITQPAAGGARANPAPGYAPLPSSPDAYAPAGGYAAASGGYSPASPPPPTPAELRAAAYRRALDASPTGEEVGGERVAVAAVPTTRAAAGDVAELAPGQGISDAAAPAGTGGVTRADQFMQTAALASNQRTVQALTVQAAPGAYSVQAGTVIPAVLMTEINSDLPGECLAQITRDVYDSRAQRFLLIPRGSKLLCKYDDQLTTGQSRLLVAWTRILLPDGRSVSLPGLPATDAAGARGVSDQVDRHARKAFGTAAALSLLGAGVQLAQPQRGSVFAPPSVGQVMAGALGQELNQVAVEMLRRDLSNRQTIRIRQGVEFNVFLNTDLTFPGPYAITRTDGGATAAPTTAAVDQSGRVVPVTRRER